MVLQFVEHISSVYHVMCVTFTSHVTFTYSACCSHSSLDSLCLFVYIILRGCGGFDYLIHTFAEWLAIMHRVTLHFSLICCRVFCCFICFA